MGKHSYRYPLPAVTVDIVIFTVSRRGDLDVLLIERRDDPFRSHAALPGGFVEVGEGYREDAAQGESLDAAAARELREETDLDVVRDNVFLEQLYTFGDPGRDPRGRAISVAYYALVGMDIAPRVRAGDDSARVYWVATSQLPKLAFDHDKVLATAISRVRGKIDYDPRIVRALLPTEFTLNDFRRVHEIVKGRPQDSSNFSKRFRRMIEDGRVEEVGAVAGMQDRGRPSALYRFPILDPFSKREIHRFPEAS
jgi:8-oxo-dGTP diphosphatase